MRRPLIFTLVGLTALGSADPGWSRSGGARRTHTDERRSTMTRSVNRRRRLVGALLGVGTTLALVIGLGTLAGAAAAAKPNLPVNTTAPTLSGIAQEGKQLTGEKGVWAGSPTDYNYFWTLCNKGGKSCANITGATAATYTLTSAGVGNTVRFKVEAKNARGNTFASSAQTAVIIAAATPPPARPTSTSLPTLSGTAQVGQTLTGTRGVWSGSPTDYNYFWTSCNKDGNGCANISGATSATYKLTSAGIGNTLRFKVEAKNAGGNAFASSLQTGLVLAAPTPAPVPMMRTVMIEAGAFSVVYGGRVMLSGMVSSHQSGQAVQIRARAYRASGYSTIATVATTTGGAWRFSPKPAILTSYVARWQATTSNAVAIGVRPRVSLRVITGGRFATTVVAARSFAGRYVAFQRRSAAGQWVTLKQLRLNTSSAAVFRSSAPSGTSSLRVFMSVNQAGVGYLAGISRTIVYYRA